MADEAGRGPDGAALTDDHRLALGLDVPDVGQRQREHLAGIERVVGLLRLAGDAVEQVVDGQAVRLRLGAGTEVGVADGGQRRHRRYVRLAVPGAAGAQPRQRRHRVLVGVEVVGARAVQHQQGDDARPRRRRHQRLAQGTADGGDRRRRAEQRGEGRHHVLLADPLGPDQRLHEGRPVEQQRDMRVVGPRRAVHERVERVAIDEELAFARHHEQLAAAAGEVAAGELGEPGVALGGRRDTRRGGGRCRGIGHRRTGSARSARGRGKRQQEGQDHGRTTHGPTLVHGRDARVPLIRPFPQWRPIALDNQPHIVIITAIHAHPEP